MDKLRALLPIILEAAGVAVSLIFLIVAGLSLDNPLAAMGLIVAGIGLGALLMGAGRLLQIGLEVEVRMRQVQGDVRALGKAIIEILNRAER